VDQGIGPNGRGAAATRDFPYVNRRTLSVSDG